MLVLHSAPASPFGRKVKITAALLGLLDRIRIEDVDTRAPAPQFWVDNPLGKIPVLVTEDGTSLFDSRVIVEYLDDLAGGGVIIPARGPERFAALKLQALADGLMDAALLQVYEARFRPEARRHSDWVAWQGGKVARALDTLATSPPAVGTAPTIGDVAVACALGYLDLRFEGRWRNDHPTLVAWLDRFAAAVPYFDKSRAPS